MAFHTGSSLRKHWLADGSYQVIGQSMCRQWRKQSWGKIGAFKYHNRLSTFYIYWHACSAAKDYRILLNPSSFCTPLLFLHTPSLFFHTGTRVLLWAQWRSGSLCVVFAAGWHHVRRLGGLLFVDPSLSVRSCLSLTPAVLVSLAIANQVCFDRWTSTLPQPGSQRGESVHHYHGRLPAKQSISRDGVPQVGANHVDQSGHGQGKHGGRNRRHLGWGRSVLMGGRTSNLGRADSLYCHD